MSRFTISAALAALFATASVFAACGGPGNSTTSGGTTASTGSSSGTGTNGSGISPNQIFRGRGTDVLVSASGTPFGAAPNVTVGSGVITISNVQVTGAGNLTFHAVVPVDDPEESADIVADGRVAATIPVKDAVRLGHDPILYYQGVPGMLDLLDDDKAHPFVTNVKVTSAKGLGLAPNGLSDASVSLAVFVALDAPEGPADLFFEFPNDANGETVTSRIKGALTIQPGPYKTLEADKPGSFMLAPGQTRLFLKLSAAGGMNGKVVDLTVKASQMGGPPTVETVLSLQDPRGGLGGPLTRITRGGTMTERIGIDGDVLAQVFLPEGPFLDSTTLAAAVRVFAAPSVPEKKPDNTSITAMVITPPVIIDGMLADPGDRAVFSITSGTGVLVARTLPVDGVDPYSQLDTSLEVLNDQLQRITNNDDEYANSTFSLVESNVPAGKKFIRIRKGDDAVVPSGKFRLLVFQR